MASNFAVVICVMQGHSTAASLPPLPENGPTEETEVQEVQDVPAKGADESPLPLATTSPTENAEKEEVDEALAEASPAPDMAKARTRKRLRVQDVSSSMSSPAKEKDLREMATRAHPTLPKPLHWQRAQ